MDRNEWLKWRHGGIGGSDAPIVMGVSPWKTPLQLYEDKILPEPVEQEPNFVTMRGDRYEPMIRALFNLMTNKDFKPALLSSEQFPFLKTSLDGRDGTDEILEIKTAGKEDQEGCKLGKIPEKYYPQVQHNLFVSGAKVCYYVSYWDPEWDERNVLPSNLEVIPVYPDPEYQSVMVAKEVEFWDTVQKRKPPMPSAGDFKTVKGLAHVATRWRKLKQKLAQVQADLESARDELLAAAEESKHPRVMIGGLKITKYAIQGTVDYKKVPALAGVDLNQYRKPGSFAYRIGDDQG